MPIVLNEVKQAEHIIEKGEVGNKPTSTLFLLGKYYRIKKNLDKKQTFSKLNEFMENNYKNYNSALWEDIIEDISKKANKYSLRELDCIGVTQQELDKISDIDNFSSKEFCAFGFIIAKAFGRVSGALWWSVKITSTPKFFNKLISLLFEMPQSTVIITFGFFFAI